jgi:hypothetical protein
MPAGDPLHSAQAVYFERCDVMLYNESLHCLHD